MNAFNPLSESEPNLHLYMSNRDSDMETPSNDMALNVKNIVTKKCVVRVRNLNQDEIDFLSRLKFSPEPPVNIDKTNQSIETMYEAEPSTSGLQMTTEENKCEPMKKETPIMDPRPKRSASNRIDYAELEKDETYDCSTDEYTPNSMKTKIKLNNKKQPSAS